MRRYTLAMRSERNLLLYRTKDILECHINRWPPQQAVSPQSQHASQLQGRLRPILLSSQEMQPHTDYLYMSEATWGCQPLQYGRGHLQVLAGGVDGRLFLFLCESHKLHITSSASSHLYAYMYLATSMYVLVCHTHTFQPNDPWVVHHVHLPIRMSIN